MRAKEEVRAAIKSKKNHTAERILPKGKAISTAGMDMNPSLKVPSLASSGTAEAPNMAKAAGMAMEAPSTTSTNSLSPAVQSPAFKTSSLDFT